MLTSSTATPVFNQAVTFTATVTAGNSRASATPTGSVVFQDTLPSPAVTIGTATITSGTATLVYSGLAVGSHTISASYQGDTNFVSSTSSVVSQTVAVTPTSTSINSNPDPSSPGQAITFTATVTPSTSGIPTGSVVFSDNGTPSISATLDSTGSTSVTISSLSTGTHTIVWNYSGDANFAASSNTMTQIVGTNAAPFSLSSSASNATVSAGGSATFTITAFTVPGLNTTISLSCSGLPTMSACQFQPTTMTPQGSKVATNLTITTTARKGALFRIPDRPPWPSIPASALVFCGAMVTLFFAFLRMYRQSQRPHLPHYAAAANLSFLLTFVVFAAACGGGNGSSSNSGGQTGTPAGTSQVTVTATSGSISQSLTITFTVN